MFQPCRLGYIPRHIMEEIKTKEFDHTVGTKVLYKSRSIPSAIPVLFPGPVEMKKKTGTNIKSIYSQTDIFLPASFLLYNLCTFT